MTESSNLLANFIKYDSSIMDQLHLNTVRSAGRHVTNQINNKQQSNAIQQSNQVPSLLIEQLIQTNRSKCVNDLNLVLTNISQLKSEVAYKIINYLKSQKSNGAVLSEYSNEEYRDKYEHETDKESYIYSDVIDQYMIILLIKIQCYLIEHRILQSYKVIALYQYRNDQPGDFKHILSVIPYMTDIPADGLSEILTSDLSGQAKTRTVATKLLNGGFMYTQDWLGLSVKDADCQNTIHKISVASGALKLRGFAFNYNIDLMIACQQTRFNMHIPELSKYW